MSASRMLALLTELKRRKVFRVATVYAAAAFVVVQAADIVFPHLQLPDWTVTLVVVLALLGFPLALVLAWAFELTPDGVVRTAEPNEGAVRPAASPRASFVSATGTGAVIVALAVGAFVLFGRGAADPPPGAAEARGDGMATPSIAVLPLEDLSPGQDHEWFSDGITEDILLHLSRMPELKVIGRTSVMRYKGREIGARQIGFELGVTTILEGSVRRAGERVRVGVQLIRADTEEQLWAESYDRDLTDIFEIQNEIARQIAGTLRQWFSPVHAPRMERAPTEALEAYDLYLRGRERARRLTRADLERSIELHREAVALDPGFARAWAGLSFSFSALEGYHHLGRHWMDSAFVAAREAVARDPEAADGYSVLALALWNTNQFEEAVEMYGRTLELRPSSGEAYWGLAFIRWIQGDLVEANRMALRAVALDPGDPGHHTLLGRTFAAAGDPAEAERRFQDAIALQEDFPWAHQDLLWLLIGTGEHERAEAHLRAIEGVPNLEREVRLNSFLLALHRGANAQAVERYRRDPGAIGGIVTPADIGFALARAGHEEEARAFWEHAIADGHASLELERDNYWSAAWLGRALVATGEVAEGLGYLEHAAERGWLAYPMVDLALDPVLRPLEGDARFERLRRRILDDTARMRAEIGRVGAR